MADAATISRKPFHGGNTGSSPVGRANHLAIATASISFKSAAMTAAMCAGMSAGALQSCLSAGLRGVQFLLIVFWAHALSTASRE